MLAHDGPSRLDLVRNALDNLTISKDPDRKLPAFIAIAVQNGGNDSKGSERGLEYDTMSDRFARFINDEVLPAVLNNAEIKLRIRTSHSRESRGAKPQWAAVRAVRRLSPWAGFVLTCFVD